MTVIHPPQWEVLGLLRQMKPLVADLRRGEQSRWKLAGLLASAVDLGATVALLSEYTHLPLSQIERLIDEFRNG